MGELEWVRDDRGVGGYETKPAGGSSPLLLATKALTNDDIVALPSTPVEIVAAPGPGVAIIPIHGLFSIFYGAGGGNYDTASIDAAGSLWIGPPPGIVGESLTGYLGRTGLGDVQNFLHGTSAAIAAVAFSPRSLVNADLGNGQETFAGPRSSSHPDLSNLDDQPLNLWVDNSSTGNFTGGDPGNNGVVTVVYYLLTLPA